jgi:hypothetical protein
MSAFPVEPAVERSGHGHDARHALSHVRGHLRRRGLELFGFLVVV